MQFEYLTPEFVYSTEPYLTPSIVVSLQLVALVILIARYDACQQDQLAEDEYLSYQLTLFLVNLLVCKFVDGQNNHDGRVVTKCEAR